MFLSRVTLAHERNSNPYRWHKQLWPLFDSANKTRPFLFHVEKASSRQSRLLVLSSIAPGHSAAQAQVLQQKEVTYPVVPGQRLAFRLCANPIKTIKDARQRTNSKNEVKSCRVPLIREDEQIAWLERKLSPAAKLVEAIVRERKHLHFRKQGQAGKITQVTFDGSLEVAEPEQFVELLRAGIGPAKAFGCGLLLVRRL